MRKLFIWYTFLSSDTQGISPNEETTSLLYDTKIESISKLKLNTHPVYLLLQQVPALRVSQDILLLF